MTKIKVYVQTNYVGSKDEAEFEVDDGATDEEIDKLAYEYVCEMIEWGWKKIRK
jgi:hypothetical protein